jgi:Zn finger protein HypA/HybF involved in hydrogenase expression
MSMSEERARNIFTGAAEEAFEELQAWCKAHPSYTLLELEEQVLVIRQRLMGKAMSSLVAQREAVKVPEGMICPKCGAKMEDKGQQSRTVGGPEGPVELSRTYYYCPSCKEGFFPSGPRAEVDQAPLD